MYPGFDVSAWDPHFVFLWRHSNLRFMGFYLSHGQGQTETSWTTHWHDLKDMGWGLIPIWLPFASNKVSDMLTANGGDHGREAISRAREAGIEKGATIYLDIETQIFIAGGDIRFINYVAEWFRTVLAAGFKPGTYCSREDAAQMLGASFRTSRPLLFPFSIGNICRAKWDDKKFKLTSVTADKWDSWSTNRTWVSSPDTVGCQYDWFNDNRDKKIFHWPNAEGKPDGGRSVDWDMSVVGDPAHPRSFAAIACCPDRTNPDRLQIFTIRNNFIEQQQRSPEGRFSLGTELLLTMKDLGPDPPPELNAFDSCDAAAVSRAGSQVDVFLAGQDGFIRTMWMNEQETFPRHVWPLNPKNPARKSTPITAVSREVDHIDIFYVSSDHQLVTQWWNPSAQNWPANIRKLPEFTVAGNTNIAAVGTPASITTPGTIDVLYVSMNYKLSYDDPSWNASWVLVCASWATDRDWTVAAVPTMTGIAAACGIAAVRDTAGVLHVVTQNRARNGLRHAQRGRDGVWQVADGPGTLNPDVNRRSWWMSLQAVVISDLILLVGITSAMRIAWSAFRRGQWSAVREDEATFSAGGRLSLATRGQTNIDIVGLNEDGVLVTRTMTADNSGNITLLPAS